MLLYLYCYYYVTILQSLPDSYCPTLFWRAAFLQLFGVTCELRKCSQCQHDASAALPPSQLQTLHSRLHMVSDQQSMKDVWLNPSWAVADRFLHDLRGQHAVERMRTE